MVRKPQRWGEAPIISCRSLIMTSKFHCPAPVSLIKLDGSEVHFSSSAHVVVDLQLMQGSTTFPTQWSNNGDNIGEKGSVGFRADDIVKALIVVGQQLPHIESKGHILVPFHWGGAIMMEDCG